MPKSSLVYQRDCDANKGSHTCTMRRRNTPFCIVFLAMCLVVDSASALCGNGVLESGLEQCDDGNTMNGDGCSNTCQLEDPNRWICVNVEGGKTSCCTALTNPVTLERVCSCKGAAQPPTNLGYYIDDNCKKQDINECNTNRGGCHEVIMPFAMLPVDA